MLDSLFKKMRAEAKEYISGDNLRTELTPFTFSKDKQLEIRYVPMAYLVELWRKIEDMLILSDKGYILK